MDVVWSGPKLGKLGRPTSEPEAYREQSEAKIKDWDNARSTTTNKCIKDSLKNKISALRHRLLLKDNKAVELNKDFQIKVFNLRLVLKIFIEMPLSLKKV